MKKWRDKLSGLRTSWRKLSVGAVVCALLGVFMFRVSTELEVLGYDLLFFGNFERPIPGEVIIVELDNYSSRELGQAGIPNWDRNLHAQLIDRLTADQARVVVFDIIFLEPGTPSANANLARAIRQNGKVVLAASLETDARPQIQAKQAILPLEVFLDAPAAGWGIAGFGSRGTIARQYYRGDDVNPSLPWIAAKVAGAPVAQSARAEPPDTWLNYYGKALTLPRVSYFEVTNFPPGYFRGKSVFVGARPKTLKAMEEADAFPTPHFRWKDNLFPGVEIGATAYLNLLRNDGLRQIPYSTQYLIIAMCGLIVGAILSPLRPLLSSLAAVFALFATLALAGTLARSHLWFGWTIIAFVQIPGALAWSIGSRVVRLKFEKDVLTRTLEETTKLVEATKATAQKRPAQLIPDHTLLKRVGKGAYGEVWLARNAIGAYHAVKITRRAGFPAEEPYEREFHGIQKFMPISRSHQGFVHILHVGRDDEQRLFYCIMEAGDDKTAGQKIDPETYTPKTLASELDWRGKLTPEETLRLGLALADALEHLHQHRLIHRDIKPANIIYVNGAPKFADIGLVTDIRSVGKDVSFLGTEGYIAPEGPGTASADVYALGKVLYEAAMGRDRRLYPEVPTAIFEEYDDALIRRLNNVINRACETSANERYQSAAALHVDLLKLQRSTV